jgi:hypothetical protein
MLTKLPSCLLVTSLSYIATPQLCQLMAVNRYWYQLIVPPFSQSSSLITNHQYGSSNDGHHQLLWSRLHLSYQARLTLAPLLRMIQSYAGHQLTHLILDGWRHGFDDLTISEPLIATIAATNQQHHHTNRYNNDPLTLSSTSTSTSMSM